MGWIYFVCIAELLATLNEMFTDGNPDFFKVYFTVEMSVNLKLNLLQLVCVTLMMLRFLFQIRKRNPVKGSVLYIYCFPQGMGWGKDVGWLPAWWT